MNRTQLNTDIKIALVKLLQSNHDNVKATEPTKVTEYQATMININLVEVQLADIRKENAEYRECKHYRDVIKSES